MISSQKLVDKIKQFEGCRLTAYRCPAGIATIGYGHTGGVRMGMTIAQDSADLYLDADIEAIERSVMKIGMPELRVNQLDAIVDFVFNLGLGNFKKSTLLKKIKTDPNDPSIPDEFRRWVYAKVKGESVKLPGLVKRREWEARRWMGTV